MRWLLLVLIGVAVFAYSEEPQQQRQSNGKPAAQDQRGTEKAPLVIKLQNTGRTPEETEEEKKERTEKSSADWWMVGLTGTLAFLAALQLGAFIVQAIYMRSTVKAMRDDFVSTHRPKIRVRHVWAEGDLYGGEKIAVRAQAVNVGVTPAKITEYSARLMTVSKEKELPPIPHYGYKVVVRVDPWLHSGLSVNLPPDADVAALVANTLPISHDDNTAIRNGSERLYALGYVAYEDSEGRPRTTAFCRVLEPPRGVGSYSEIGRFVPLDPPNTDYEYED